jgi:hypothetical protein
LPQTCHNAKDLEIDCSRLFIDRIAVIQQSNLRPTGFCSQGRWVIGPMRKSLKRRLINILHRLQPLWSTCSDSDSRLIAGIHVTNCKRCEYSLMARLSGSRSGCCSICRSEPQSFSDREIYFRNDVIDDSIRLTGCAARFSECVESFSAIKLRQ